MTRLTSTSILIAILFLTYVPARSQTAAPSKEEESIGERTIPAPKVLEHVPSSGLPAGSSNYALYSTQFIPTDTLLIGDGFNTATSEGLASCVEFSGEKDLTRAAGEQTSAQSTTYNFVQLTSFQSLKTYLSISATASVGLGIYSGDASVKMTSSGDYSKYSNYVMVDVLVKNPTEQLKRRHLTASALRYAEAGRTTFMDTCGNEFIYARQTGGRLTGILEFSSSSSAEQSALTANLNVAIGAWASGSASVEQTVQKLSTMSATHLSVLKDGGLGPIPNPNALLEASLHFPDTVRSREASNKAKSEECEKTSSELTKASCIQYEPVVFNLVSRTYKSVDNLPSNLRNFDSIDAQEKTLTAIGTFLEKAYAVKGDLTFVNTHPTQFVDYSKTKWDAAWNKNEDAIALLVAAADKCRQVTKVASCVLPTAPDFSDPYEPTRRTEACKSSWVSSIGGLALTETFPHAGVPKVLGVHYDDQGSFHLKTPNARIDSVAWTCSGYACGWSYNPAGGYTANYQLIDNATGFTWHRHYENSLEIAETYTASISVLVDSCGKPPATWTMTGLDAIVLTPQ